MWLAKAWTAIDRLLVIPDWLNEVLIHLSSGHVDTAIWMHHMDANKLKSLTAITQECCEQYWTSPGDSTLQSSSCTATYHPSRKLSKLDEPDIRDTAGEVGMSSSVMYSCGPLHMDEHRLDVQLEPTYSSSVPIQVVALRTCWKPWTIGKCGERWSEKSVLIAQHHDDDDDI